MRCTILTFSVLVFFALCIQQRALAQDAEEPPPVPAEITDQSIPSQELILRLTPLTIPELEAAASAWLEIVKEKTIEITGQQIEVLRSEGTAADTARERLSELVRERGKLFDNYSTVVNAWELKGGDEAKIKEYRAYRNAIAVEETRTADVETLFQQALEWAKDRDGGIQLAIDVAIIVGALIGLFILAALIRALFGRGVRRIPNLSQLLQAFLLGVIYWLTIAIGLIVVLSALGIDISPLFALVGGAAFILAFALQDTLGNLASGLMIMINRPFDVGDYVDAGGIAGTVRSVSVASTTLVTPDNQVIVIPNKTVWGNVITNVTTSSTRRVDLVFGIGYQDSIEDAQRVMEEVAANHPLVLSDPAPVVRVHELGESSVNFVCRPWVNSADYWTVFWDLHRQVKERFDQEGISIPFPQRDVHVYATPAAPSDAVSEPSTSTTGDTASLARSEPANEDKEGDPA